MAKWNRVLFSIWPWWLTLTTRRRRRRRRRREFVGLFLRKKNTWATLYPRKKSGLFCSTSLQKKKSPYEPIDISCKKGNSDSFVESKVQSKMTYWKQRLSWLLTRRISITTFFRSDLLLRNFHVNDQHIEIFGNIRWFTRG